MSIQPSSETDIALRAYAAQHGHSLSHAADILLRQALGLPAPTKAPRPGRPAKGPNTYLAHLAWMPFPFNDAEAPGGPTGDALHQWTKRLWVRKKADGLWHKTDLFPQAECDAIVERVGT